jgi:hypothetical protein
MRTHARRNRRWLSKVISSLALLAPVTAFAETNLRWTLPADSPPADVFRVYVGPPISDEGYLVYAGLPIPDAQGIYSADVQIDEIDQGIPVYVWLTAANAYGESDSSNANFYPVECDPLLDADCDGLLDDGASGDVPCMTGQTFGCDDNCPNAWNPDQYDTAGVGTGSLPDGIGDECQCGDVSGDGQVSSVDTAIIMRALMQPPLATMERPELCDVGGSLGCSSVDAAIAFRALMVPPLAAIQQQCPPAQPPLP